MRSLIFDLSLQARTLDMILRIPLIKLIGLKSSICLAPAILGTIAMKVLLNRKDPDYHHRIKAWKISMKS